MDEGVEAVGAESSGGSSADEFARLMAQGVRICADADDRYHDPSRIDTSAGLYRQAAALGNKKAALNLRFSNFTGLYTTATALDARTERRVHALSIPLDKRKSRRRFIAVISGGLAELAQAELLQVEGVASVELLFDVNPLAGERAIGEFYGALVVTVFDDVEEATIGCIIHHPCVVVTMVAVAASSGRSIQLPGDLSGVEARESMVEGARFLCKLHANSMDESSKNRTFRTVVVCCGGGQGRLDLERQLADHVFGAVEQRWRVSLEDPDIVFLGLSSPLGFCCGFVLSKTCTRSSWRQGRIPVEVRSWFTQTTTRARMRPSRAWILAKQILVDHVQLVDECGHAMRPPLTQPSISSTVRIVDLCGGLGTIPLEVAHVLVGAGLQNKHDIEIFSLDIDPDAKRMVKHCWQDMESSMRGKKLPAFRAVTGSCYAMPLADSSVDLVFSDLPYGRQHAQKLDFCYVLMELARVLKIGAKALLLVSIEQTPKLFRACKRFPPSKNEPIWAHVDLTTKSSAKVCFRGSLGLNAGGIDCVAVCLQLLHKKWKWRKSRWWTTSRDKFDLQNEPLITD